jgi:hypothetical protein
MYSEIWYTFCVCWCYVYSGEYEWCFWCYSECASTPVKLKSLLDHGGNRTCDLWDISLSTELRELLEPTWPRSSGWNYTIPDWFSYRIDFHSEVKNKGVYTMHAASLSCQLMSRCRYGNK